MGWINEIKNSKKSRDTATLNKWKFKYCVMDGSFQILCSNCQPAEVSQGQQRQEGIDEITYSITWKKMSSSPTVWFTAVCRETFLECFSFSNPLTNLSCVVDLLSWWAVRRREPSSAQSERRSAEILLISSSAAQPGDQLMSRHRQVKIISWCPGNTR